MKNPTKNNTLTSTPLLFSGVRSFLRPFLKPLLSPLLERTDPETFSITRFIQWTAQQVCTGERVLDAGAGDCKYKKYFKHARYESTDFENVFDASVRGIHDFVCDLTSIPKENDSYDSIICTQVLEHVPDPQLVLNEFHRILKPGGKLFLTCPQGWGLHGEPYNFFNFAKYGLENLFKQSGFSIVFIRARGGIFWYGGEIIKILPAYLLNQYCDKDGFCNKLFRVVFSPLIFIFFRFIPLVLFYVDRIDVKRGWTLGYSCYCIKEGI